MQAFLRTGYYLPEHPQSRMAKAGLYSRFKSLFTGRHELTFTEFLRIEFPSGILTASGTTNSIGPATHVIGFNQVMYVVLDRTPSGSPPGGPFIVDNGLVPVGDDIFIIANRPDPLLFIR